MLEKSVTYACPVTCYVIVIINISAHEFSRNEPELDTMLVFFIQIRLYMYVVCKKS